MAERREALVGTLVETLCQPSELAQKSWNPGDRPHGSSDFIGFYRLTSLASRQDGISTEALGRAAHADASVALSLLVRRLANRQGFMQILHETSGSAPYSCQAGLRGSRPRADRLETTTPDSFL